MIEITDLKREKEIVEVIHQVTKLSAKHIRYRIMARDDFPQPRKQFGRIKLYAMQDIEKFLLQP